MRNIKSTSHSSEAQEQTALFAWADQCVQLGVHPELKMMYAIPNGGRRDRIEAAHLTQQGVRAGVPDICLAVPRGKYHGLYVEMKVGDNKPTDKQNEWLANLSHYGYAVKVCYSCLAARAAIEKYLSMEAAK